VVVFGYSHLASLIHAARKADLPLAAIPLKQVSKSGVLVDGKIIPSLQTTFLDAVAAAGTKPLFSAIGGSVHTWLGLFQHPRPFDFVVPEHEHLALDPTADILPYRAIHDTISQLTHPDFAFLSALQDIVSVPLVHIGCPPPAKCVDISVYQLRDADLAKDTQLSPAPLRYKLWLTDALIMRARCQELGIRFVEPPNEALENGYLKQTFQKDAAHGNTGYGHLVLRQMEALAN